MIKLEVNHQKHKKNAVEGQPNVARKDVQNSSSSKVKEKEKEQRKGQNQAQVKQADKKGRDKQQENKKKLTLQQKSKQKQKPDQKEPKSKAVDDSNNKKKQQQPPNSTQKDKELATIQTIKLAENNTKKTIEQLIQQYKLAARDLWFENNGHDPIKEQQIQAKLQKLSKEKEKRHRNMADLQAKANKMQQSREKIEQVNMEMRKERLKKKKIDGIESKLEELHLLSRERAEKHERFLQYAAERAKFQPRFKKYEQREKESKQEEFLQFREQLQMIGDRVGKSIDIDQIDKFEEQYRAQKMDVEAYRRNKLRNEKEILHDENAWMRGVWKGKCHQVDVSERRELKEAKESAKLKREKLKEYGKMLSAELKKNRVKSRILSVHQSQGQSANENEEVVYRQKFVNGVNYGKVKQHRKLALSVEEKHKLGNDYLEEQRDLNSKATAGVAKLLPYQLIQVVPVPEKPKETFKVKRKTNPFYSVDHTPKTLAIKDQTSVALNLDRIEVISQDFELQSKIMKHGEYTNVIELQQRKSKVNRILAEKVSRKLSLLEKISDSP